MNRQWQISTIPNHTAHPWPRMSNSATRCEWSPFQSPINSHLLQADLSNVIGPQFSAMCYPSNQNMSSSSALDMGSAWTPIHQPPKNPVSMISAKNMTIEQTADWVRTLGRYNSWIEADEYADSFTKNKVGGQLLPKLTNELLKEDLGIVKYGHRLHIIMAIMRVFPESAVSEHLAEEQEPKRQSPMSISTAESSVVEGAAFTFQKGSPSMRSIMASSSCKGDLELKKHKTEVMKWTGSPAKSSPTVCSCSSKDLPFNTNCKNFRAKPTNPKVYKTLQKVKLRAGKSGLSKVIGHLLKGSVVVINQIKGRSGRVVFQKEDGRFKKVGWVSLFTEDKKQLLKKYIPKTNDFGAVSSYAQAIIVE